MSASRREVCLFFVLVLGADFAQAARSFSLQPATVIAGQLAYVPADDSDGCYEVDGFELERNGANVVLEITVSDFVVTPCPANHTTPMTFALGTFEAGTYAVDVRECVFSPFPCATHTTLSLQVAGIAGPSPTPVTIPALGAIAAMLLGTGAMLFALAKLTGPRAGPRR